MQRLEDHVGTLAIGLAAVALGAAFVAQYGFGLAPCPLCVWQRWPYAAAIAIGIAALAWRRGGGAFAVLAALAFATTAGIAVFHVGVEEGYWRGLESCSAVSTPDSLEALRAEIMGQQPARCDQVAWSFLGLSIAGWNVVYAGLAAILMLTLAIRLSRRTR